MSILNFLSHGFRLTLPILLASSAAAQPVVKTYSNLSGSPSVLQLFLPPGTVARPRPALLLFHGGSWNSGGPGALADLSTRIARHGYVVASAGYRLVPKAGSGQDPGVCVADAFLALAWLHEHAAELAIDPARIAVGGASAGGHLALCLCVAQNFDSPDLKGVPRYAPFACVTLNPVVDTASPRWSKLFARYGTTLDPTVLAQSHRLAPTLLLNGDDDQIVPLEVVRRFEAAVSKGGGRVERKTYAGAGHGFFNSDRASPERLLDIEQRIVAFLDGLPAPR